MEGRKNFNRKTWFGKKIAKNYVLFIIQCSTYFKLECLKKMRGHSIKISNTLTLQKISPLLHREKAVLKNYVACNDTLKELEPEIF